MDAIQIKGMVVLDMNEGSMKSDTTCVKSIEYSYWTPCREASSACRMPEFERVGGACSGACRGCRDSQGLWRLLRELNT